MKTKEGKGSNVYSGIIIVLCIIVGILVWKFVMGHASNFEGGDAENGHPLPGNYLGMVYKGGYVVPVLMGLLLMALVFSIERFIVLFGAGGKGDLEQFVSTVTEQLASGDVEGAKATCDAQQGSVANVVRSGLSRYEALKSAGAEIDQAVEAIEKELETATALEMPMLEKNMTIISTLVSIGTLIGLLGTVSGMIKAFSGLAAAGAPDQAALANGISEALINTATGIGTSTLAVISYNYFTSKIDTLTSFIEEAGSVITRSYKRTSKA